MPAGFALRVSSHFVRGRSRTSFARADHRTATVPTTCGPAIEVPLMFPYAVSLVRRVERTVEPRATRSGFIRPEPSTVTVPRLLKLEIAFVAVIEPVENDDS